MLDELTGGPVAPTTDTTRPDDADDARDRSVVSPPPLDRIWLAITAVVVATSNWAFSGDRIIFHLLADEPATLGMARWMSGRNRWNLFDHSTWQPGLAILVSPIYWFTTDPVWVVRWAIGVNALIAGAAAVVAAVLARRLGSLPTRTAALLAIIVATLPSALSGASYVWGEALVTLTFTAAVLCTIRIADRDAPLWAFGSVTIAALGYLSHGRLLPFFAMIVVTVVAITLWQRRWRVTAATGAVALVAFTVARTITTTVHRRVWDDPGAVNTSGSVFRRLERPVDVLEHLAGQMWYQLVVTLGVGAVGIVVVLRTLFTGDRPGVVDRRSAWVVAVLTAPQIVVSATFLVGRGRADQVIYGRYNDAVMWPIVLIGLIWFVRLAQRGRSRAALIDATLVVVTVVAVGVTTVVLHTDTVADDIGLRSMVPGVLAFVGRADGVPLVRITVIATVTFVVAVGGTLVLRRLRPGLLAPVGAVAVTAALIAGAVRLHDGEARLLNGWAAVRPVEEVDRLLPDGAGIGVKVVSDSDDPSLSRTRQRHRYQVYQLYLPDRSFERDRGLDDDVGPFVFAPRGDPELIAAGAEVVWNDPEAKMTLYRVPDTAPASDS